jgi:hypothetical protein
MTCLLPMCQAGLRASSPLVGLTSRSARRARLSEHVVSAQCGSQAAALYCAATADNLCEGCYSPSSLDKARTQSQPKQNQRLLSHTQWECHHYEHRPIAVQATSYASSRDGFGWDGSGGRANPSAPQPFLFPRRRYAASLRCAPASRGAEEGPTSMGPRRALRLRCDVENACIASEHAGFIMTWPTTTNMPKRHGASTHPPRGARVCDSELHGQGTSETRQAPGGRKRRLAGQHRRVLFCGSTCAITALRGLLLAKAGGRSGWSRWSSTPRREPKEVRAAWMSWRARVPPLRLTLPAREWDCYACLPLCGPGLSSPLSPILWAPSGWPKLVDARGELDRVLALAFALTFLCAFGLLVALTFSFTFGFACACRLTPAFALALCPFHQPPSATSFDDFDIGKNKNT